MSQTLAEKKIIEFAENLAKGWQKYVEMSGGEVPHGTRKQMAALLELSKFRELLTELAKERTDEIRGIIEGMKYYKGSNPTLIHWCTITCANAPRLYNEALDDLQKKVI